MQTKGFIHTKSDLEQFEKTLLAEKYRLLQTISRLDETGIGDTILSSIMAVQKNNLTYSK